MPRSNLAWRTTWFGNRVRDPVSNVTIATAGANVTQQRQNLGRTRIRGLQTDVDYRVGRPGACPARTCSTRRGPEFAANPALVGNTCRRCRGIAARSSSPTPTCATSTSPSASRLSDVSSTTTTTCGWCRADTTPGLPGYALLGFTVSRPLGRTFDVFASAQNLFDEEYFVGTLPTTVGSPRLVSVGVRVRWAGK